MTVMEIFGYPPRRVRGCFIVAYVTVDPAARGAEILCTGVLFQEKGFPALKKPTEHSRVRSLTADTFPDDRRWVRPTGGKSGLRRAP